VQALQEDAAAQPACSICTLGRVDTLFMRTSQNAGPKHDGSRAMGPEEGEDLATNRGDFSNIGDFGEQFPISPTSPPSRRTIPTATFVARALSGP